MQRAHSSVYRVRRNHATTSGVPRHGVALHKYVGKAPVRGLRDDRCVTAATPVLRVRCAGIPSPPRRCCPAVTPWLNFLKVFHQQPLRFQYFQQSTQLLSYGSLNWWEKKLINLYCNSDSKTRGSLATPQQLSDLLIPLYAGDEPFVLSLKKQILVI